MQQPAQRDQTTANNSSSLETNARIGKIRDRSPTTLEVRNGDQMAVQVQEQPHQQKEIKSLPAAPTELNQLDLHRQTANNNHQNLKLGNHPMLPTSTKQQQLKHNKHHRHTEGIQRILICHELEKLAMANLQCIKKQYSVQTPT
ncbi:633_t:CDS:2 [Ambispora gerdemannii]|uniref:633_t:CDS:1 n=1 Tax=Ambispora gerdemannii TaxID=144530 RepID=A0A9N9EYV7_9GLOM|nr:633_t:CDS:2 [Ambispora gerdemannii]